MKKVELTKVYVDGNTIRYEVCEEPGLGLLQQEKVELFIRYHFNESFECDLGKAPLSILTVPVSLYLIPITYFYNVELVIPELDKELCDRLPRIYEAYSKVYGPFNASWRGKISVKKIVENHFVGDAKYDKAVFFSGGVDACHAGISNPGKRSLLVSIPDIEWKAKNEGPLRDEKFSLIKDFSNVVNSDWILISNNFNACLFRDQEINSYLGGIRGLASPAFKFDGWLGIKYLPNMCNVAPLAYLTGIRFLVMGSSCESIDGIYAENFDGANPAISNSIAFAHISFAEQDGLYVRRSKKVRDIVGWCRTHGKRTKLWVCFDDARVQCGFCKKCVRTQLNVLCAGENPKEWGFDGFSEKMFAKFIRDYQYRESTPCWLWDNIETIEDGRVYPHLNGLLHWLKKIGYKEYIRRAEKRARPTMMMRMLSIRRYPHYAKVIALRILGH